MKPIFFYLPENGFGVLFSTNKLLCKRKTRREFHMYDKRENVYFHEETTTGNRQTPKMAGKSRSRGRFRCSRFT